jgi:hypothetical protein
MFVDEINVDLTNNVKEIIFWLSYFKFNFIIKQNNSTKVCENIKLRCWKLS